MRIILDIKFLSKEYLPGPHRVIFEAIIEMARRHTGDSFVFLTLERGRSLANLPSNVVIQFIKKSPWQWLGKRWWYRNILPGILKKMQPSLFIAVDNIYVNNKGLPTCLFIIQLNLWLEAAKTNNRSGDGNTLLHSSFKQATALITFSEYSRQMIQRQTSIRLERIKLLGLTSINTIKSLTWTEKESIKVQYAAGCEYFLFAGELDSGHNLYGLLKAFSQFKKRQQSNMQLVLAGNKTSWMGEFNEKLATFKYRADVHVITNTSVQELDRIIGAAYAFVYPAQFDYFPDNILLAMKAGVPVIASKVPVIEEMAGSFVLYPRNNDEDGFAKSLQDIYKDENLRSRMIEAAKNHLLAAKQYDMIEDCRNFFEVIFTTKS